MQFQAKIKSTNFSIRNNKLKKIRSFATLIEYVHCVLCAVCIVHKHNPTPLQSPE
jgi:hypothetical protein